MTKNAVNIILILLLGFYHSYARSVSIYGIKSDRYPVVSAKFFILDDNGERIIVNDKEKFRIFENNAEKEVISVYCPIKTDAERISSVLTIDVSGSMLGKNMELAKLAARTWINTLNLERSQCAITSFDDFSYVNQDLTNNYDKLKRAVDMLKSAMGGTNYNEALMNEKTGALSIVSAGLHKKIIVFLTDGTANADSNAIIAKAKEIGAVIHTIVLAIEAPSVLKRISSKTGGMTFENVTGLEDIERIYRIILLDALELMPCEIEWKSDLCDNKRQVELRYLNDTLKDIANYSIADSLLPSINYLPANFIRFGFVKPGETKTAKIELSSKEKININTITTSNPSLFQIIDYGGSPPPFQLFSSQSRTLTIQFSPVDSAKSYSRFDIITDACSNKSFFAEGGYAGIPAKDTTLKILHPNGNEVFISASESFISWDGILPSDTLILEFSENNGLDWENITNNARGFLHKWQVPNIASDKCLIKARHISSPGDNKDTHFGWYYFQNEYNSVRSIAISPNGSKIAAGGDKGVIIVWDSETKEVLLQRSTNLSYIYALSWHSNGDLLAAGGSGNSIIVLNLQNNTLADYSPGHSSDIYALEWSPSGNFLASGGADSKVIVWDYQKMTLVTSFNNHKNSITSLTWMKPSGNLIASSSRDGTARIWNSVDANQIRAYTSHNSPVTSVDWSSNGKIVSADDKGDIHIWNYSNGELLKNITNTNEYINSLKWDVNGDRFVSGGSGLFVKLWDVVTGQIIESFGGHLDVISSINFSKDNLHIFSAGYDQSVKKWKIGSSKPLTPFVQSDVSDKVFSIIKPNISVRDVHFGTIFTGNKRDSLVNAIIINQSPVDLRIDSIKLIQNGDNPFYLTYNPAPLYLKTGDNLSLEIIFTAVSDKLHNAHLEVYSSGYIFVGQLYGEGSRPSLEMINRSFDFGKVPVNAGNSKLITVLKNVGTSPVEFLSIEKIGPDTSQFLIVQINDEENKSFPFVLPQASNIELLLVFAPKQPGKTSGNIAFHFRGTGSPKIMRLFGEGVDAELLAPKKLYLPAMVCEKSIIDTVVEISNTGSNILTVSSADFSSNGSDDFSFVDEEIPFSIEPYTTKYLKIRFSPATYASKSTTLTLLSNASNANDGLTDIEIFTEFHNVDFSINPEHIRMNDLDPDIQHYTTFTIENKGTYPLRWILPQVVGKFSITTIEPNPTPPNSISSATLQFEGGETGMVYDETYSLYDTCGGRKFIFLRAVIKTNQAQILTSNSINFPEQFCNNTPVDTLLEIKNSGKTDLLIYNTSIIDDDNSVFEIINSLENETIKPDSTKYLQIKATNSEYGEFKAVLIIKSNAINAEDSISKIAISFRKNKVDFSLSIDEIFFGSSIENTSEIARLTIDNKGTYPIYWEIPQPSPPFSILSIEPRTTPPEGSSIVEVLFSGGSYGEDYSNSFIFKDTCDEIKELKMRASIRQTPSVTIQVGIESAKPGDIVEIPIFLRDSSQLKNSLIIGYTAELKSKAAILVPLDTSNKGIIVDGWRYLPFNLPAYPDEGNVLKRIEYRAVLGNTETTPLELVNFKPIGGNLIRTIIPGMFSLEGLCEEGGKRLYYENEILLGNAVPNPANSQVKIDFTLKQPTNISLEIYDAFGRKAISLADRYFLAGDHSLIINVDMLPSGAYSYHLVSVASKEVKFFSIIR